MRINGMFNSRLGSLVARQKDLFFTTSAFTTFSPADLTPIFNGDDAKSDILEDTHLQQIFANLSPKIQNQPWTLAYSTQVNGFSLKNLYRECKSSNVDDPSAAFRNQGRNHTSAKGEIKDISFRLSLVMAVQPTLLCYFLLGERLSFT